MKKRALEDPSLDNYTRHVLSRLEPDVLASLTEHQFSAVRHAIEQARPISRHAIDIRGVIPLIFARFYFVLLAGRDRRPDTRGRENRLRHALSSAFGALVLGGVILIPITVIVLFIGYAMKSFLGLDLIPNQHFFEFLR